MKTQSFGIELALSLTALVALTACGDEENPTVSINVYASQFGDANSPTRLSESNWANQLQVLLVNGEGQYSGLFNAESASGAVPEVPMGSAYQVLVQGLTSQSSAQTSTMGATTASQQTTSSPSSSYQLTAYGASMPFDVTGEVAPEVSVQVGRAECVGVNRASPTAPANAAASPSLLAARAGMTATTLLDGRVLIVGGGAVNPTTGLIDGAGLVGQMEIYDPVNARFEAVPGSLITPRAYHTATLLDSGNVLIYGGVTNVTVDQNGMTRPTVVGTAELVQTESMQVVSLTILQPSPFEPRWRHSAVKLLDGSVLIAGGETEAAATSRPLKTAFRYVPGTQPGVAGAFERVGDLAVARAGHTLTAINWGPEAAVVIGGQGEDGAPVPQIEVFTTRAGTATPEGGSVYCQAELNNPQPGSPTTGVAGCFIGISAQGGGESLLPTPVWGHAAVAVEGGSRVLFMGGYTGQDKSQASADVFLYERDSDTGETAVRLAGTPLAFPGGDMALIPIYNGKTEQVLAIGGQVGGQPSMNASVFNEATTVMPPQLAFLEQPIAKVQDAAGTWTATSDVACLTHTPRWGIAAARLQNETILLVGGVSSPSPTAKASAIDAEIFFPKVYSLNTSAR